MLKKISIRLGLIASGLALGLLVLEIGLRLTCPTDKFLSEHQIFGTYHIPNSQGWHCSREFRVWIEINSKGLRDQEYSYGKTPGVHRTLILGDSFADGLQVSLADTFQARLEQQLNEQHHGQKFEVINGGVFGWGTGRQLHFFREEGYKYQPDVVLLMFYVGNDVIENLEDFAALTELEKQARSGSRPEPGEGDETPLALNRIAGSSLAKSRLYQAVRNIALRSPKITQWLISWRIKPERFTHYDIYLAQQPVDIERGWGITKIFLKQLQEEVEKRNATMYVMVIPASVQIYDELWQVATDLYFQDLAATAMDRNKPDAHLIKILDELNIPYHFLLPSFQAYASTTSDYLYYPHDGHWNVQGHALASQVIYDYLLEQRAVSTNYSKRDQHE
jgi:hypothetical protein